MTRIPVRSLTMLALATVFVAACGGGGTTKTVRTVSDPSTHNVYTGDTTDQVINAALSANDIELAGLAGYQKVACKKDSAQGPGDPPACRENEAEGALVEVLAATTGCTPGWVRPEQVPDIFRADLPAGQTKLVAVAHPLADPAAFGGGFGANTVAIFRTGDHSDGEAMGVSLHIKGGRVVWIESDCKSALELLGADRIADYIIDPNGTVTPPTPLPVPSETPAPAPSPSDTPAA